MKNRDEGKSVFGMFWKLSRSQRTLVSALSLVLIPTCIGLTYLLSDFWLTNRTRNRLLVSSTARDTLILSGYDQAVRLFLVANEVYTYPIRKDSLRAPFQQLVRSVHGAETRYLDLLNDVPPPERDSLGEKFNRLRLMFDDLIEKSENVFSSSLQSPGPGGANVPPASLPTFMVEPNFYFRQMRQHLDDALRAELAEDRSQIQRSHTETELITYRGFSIAFFLFALGATLAVMNVRRNKQHEERRRRYETLLDASPNPVEVLDINGNIIYVNPAFEGWIGMSSAGLLGRSIFEGVQVSGQSEENDVLWDRVSSVMSTGRAWSGDIELRKLGGEIKYALLIISPIVDEDGNLIEAVGIHHDVTERRELARKFAESQEKYQNIVESSLDGIVIVQDGKLVFVNASSSKIFGYDSPEEMRNVSFVDTVAPSNRFLVLEGYEGKSIGEDVLRNFEMKGLTKNGRVIDLEVNAKLVSWNGKPAVQASFRDITQRKALEREQALWLWEQETMSAIDRQLVSSVDLQSVLDAISYHAKALTRADWAGVMMVDLETNLVRWRAMTGNRVLMPSDPIRLEKAHAEIVRSKEHVIMKNIGTDPDFPIEQFPPFEEERILSAVRFPLFVEKEIRGQLVIGYRRTHDFATREIRLLTSLAEKSSIALANAQLYDNLLSRERELEMLSGARVTAQEEERRRIAREIHDSLGQMLTAIKFNVEILEDAADLQSAEDRKRISDIKGLLDNAMAEAREISYDLMPSVLVDFGLVPALQFLGEQFSKRNQLNVQVHTNGVDGRLDPSIEVGLYRIAQEALTNITKHAAAHEVNVQLIGDSKSIRLIVEDDGIGFRINKFEPRSLQRHGMGLLSMRERAASLNGMFVLDSHPGRGTEILVEIPGMTANHHE